jgi:hypothetical protein
VGLPVLGERGLRQGQVVEHLGETAWVLFDDGSRRLCPLEALVAVAQEPSRVR